MHSAKGRGEACEVKALKVVPMGVLGDDGAISDEEVKGGSNASSKLVKGVSSVKLDSSRKEDSQSS